MLAARRHECGLAAVDVDYDAAAFGVVVHQHAQVLFLQHALGHAKERGADGLADAGLAGMVLAGEHRDGRRCGDVHPGHAQDVVDCDACDLHSRASLVSSAPWGCSSCQAFQPLTHSMHRAPGITGQAAWSRPSAAASRPCKYASSSSACRGCCSIALNSASTTSSSLMPPPSLL